MKEFPSDTRYVVSEKGEVFYEGVLCKTHSDRKGYIGVNIRALKRSVGVHRVVAMTYLPNPENKPTVNHINAIKNDNNLSNLEWSTFQEQSDHSHREGLYWVQKCEDAHQSTMTNQEVIEICELLMTGIMPKELSEKMDIPLTRVADIKRQKSYKDITRTYNFPKRFTKQKCSKTIETAT